MKHDKSTYKTWFFDCDGVLLDSNRIKSEGMSEVAAYFSPNMVGDFVQYHQKNAGVSRFVKFDYFFSTMLERKDYRQDFDMAVRLFADYCFEKMMICDLSPGLVKWLRALPLDSKKYIISGGGCSPNCTRFSVLGISIHISMGFTEVQCQKRKISVMLIKAFRLRGRLFS